MSVIYTVSVASLISFASGISLATVTSFSTVTSFTTVTSYDPADQLALSMRCARDPKLDFDLPCQQLRNLFIAPAQLVSEDFL